MYSSAAELKPRLLACTSPVLSPHQFLPLKIHGYATLSEGFEYTLHGITQPQATIDENKLLGQPLSCIIHYRNQQPCYLHGIITAFTCSLLSDEMSLTIAPQFSLLKQTQDCRIYQHKSVIDIVRMLFKEFDLYDYDCSQLMRAYPPITYLTQYNESYYQFIMRILNNAGIFFYFEHQAEKHIMHLVDSPLKTPLIDDVIYQPKQAVRSPHITQWFDSQALCAQQITQTDYNPEQPTSVLTTQAHSPNPRQHGLLTHLNYQCHPGGYATIEQGRDVTKQKMNALYSQTHYKSGHSDCDRLHVGTRFKIQGDNNQHSYLITHMQLQAEDNAHGHSGDTDFVKSYRNQFKAHPLYVAPYAPSPINKPQATHIDSAVVTGPNNKTIHMDKQGRIKVRFHWDRYGPLDDNSSTWLRVMQPIASTKAGTLHTPRVGDEVLIGFMDDDIDKPFVLASVYNQTHQPSYNLPEQRFVSGIKTDCNNELSFNDTPGSESININAHRDLSQQVMKDHSQEIKGHYNSTIKTGDHRIHVKNGDYSIDVAQSIRIQVHNSILSITPSGITINSPKININTGTARTVAPSVDAITNVGEYWVQGHYVNAPADMPYQITHSDGSVVKGTLNSAGQTDKITHLKAGTATIEFGNKAQLQRQLEQQRTQLKNVLDNILEEEKKQVRIDHQQLKEPWWDQIYTYGKGFVSSLGHGSYRAVKSCSHAVVSMFEGTSEIMAIVLKADIDQLTGNFKDLKAQQAKIANKEHAIIKEIESAYQEMHLLYTDQPSRELLENFAEQYYHNMDGLMMLKEVSEFVGGFIPAIVIALILKNPAALGDGLGPAITNLVDRVSDCLAEMVETLRKIKTCRIITNARLNKLHKVDPLLDRLEKEEAPGAHFHKRHGAHIPDEAIRQRSITGISPDGKRGRPGESSKFLSHRAQRTVIKKAKREYHKTGKKDILVNLHRKLGKVYLKGGRGSILTKQAIVYFNKRGEITTAYPILPE